MQRRLLTLAARPQLVASVTARRPLHQFSGAICAPSPLLRAPASPSASPPARPAIATATQADAEALVTRWCTPLSGTAVTPTKPPTGAELVVCVAGAQLSGAATKDPLQHLIENLVASVLQTTNGPRRTVELWCADVIHGHVGGESLLYALQQIERALAYEYGAGAYTTVDEKVVAGEVSVVEAKEIALTVLAARIALEGLLLDRVSAAKYNVVVEDVQSKTATQAAQGSASVKKKDVDEYTTSVDRVLNAVEHVYWCVSAPLHDGAYPVATPPLHEGPLITDVALPSDRHTWWVEYTRTMTTTALRPVLLSSLVTRPGALPEAVRRADEQVVETFNFTLRVLYGKFGSYDSLSLAEKMNYFVRVVFPYLCKDGPFLLSASWEGAKAEAPAVSAAAAAKQSTVAAKKQTKAKAATQAAPSASSKSSKAAPSAAGGDQKNQLTLVVLLVLLAIGYVVTTSSPTAHSGGPNTKADAVEEATKMEEEMVSAGHKKANYQKLLSDIKAK